MKKIEKLFIDYKNDASNWITLAGGEYYPDILKDACNLYKPVLVIFGQLLKSSESSSGTTFFLVSICWLDSCRYSETSPVFYLLAAGSSTFSSGLPSDFLFLSGEPLLDIYKFNN